MRVSALLEPHVLASRSRSSDDIHSSSHNSTVGAHDRSDASRAAALVHSIVVYGRFERHERDAKGRDGDRARALHLGQRVSSELFVGSKSSGSSSSDGSSANSKSSASRESPPLPLQQQQQPDDPWVLAHADTESSEVRVCIMTMVVVMMGLSSSYEALRGRVCERLCARAGNAPTD